MAGISVIQADESSNGGKSKPAKIVAPKAPPVRKKGGPKPAKK